MVREVVDLVTAAQGQRFAAHQLVVGPQLVVYYQTVLSPLVVAIVQGLLRDGNELAARRSGARALGVPFDFSRPKDVFFALAHPNDVWHHGVVIPHGHSFLKGSYRPDTGKIVVLSDDRSGCFAHQVAELLLLHGFGLTAHSFQLTEAFAVDERKDIVKNGHKSPAFFFVQI